MSSSSNELHHRLIAFLVYLAVTLLLSPACNQKFGSQTCHALRVTRYSGKSGSLQQSFHKKVFGHITAQFQLYIHAKTPLAQGTDNTSPHFTYTCKAFISVNAVHLQCTCSRIMIPTSLEVDELEKTYLDSARPWPQSNISTKGTANTKPQN